MHASVGIVSFDTRPHSGHVSWLMVIMFTVRSVLREQLATPPSQSRPSKVLLLRGNSNRQIVE